MTHAEMAHVEEASRTATAWLPDPTESRASLMPLLLMSILPAIGLLAAATTLFLTMV
jgi:hypothetical protein